MINTTELNEDGRWQEAEKLAMSDYSYRVEQDTLSDGTKLFELKGVELPARAHGKTFSEAMMEFRLALQTIIYHLLEEEIEVPQPAQDSGRSVSSNSEPANFLSKTEAEARFDHNEQLELLPA